ncbi:hypothetical protein KC640_00830, partial [Candidatus Dojkabacteria bacterium]|nr:hypothetical protein [Candidatus Dojkabacteria bacterium]
QTVELAALVHVPNSVVGILLLAIGTNIPEIAIIFRSRNSEEEKLAVGNILGSAAINTGTLGLLGIIASPSLPNYVSLIPAITFLVVTLIVFAALAKTGSEITRREGYLLFTIYTVFILLEFSSLLSSSTTIS